MKKFILTIISAFVAFNIAFPSKSSASDFAIADYSGSLTPYPEPVHALVLPDSLKPVFINHVGRHGARYPASPAFTVALEGVLKKADALGTITPTGRKLLDLVNFVKRVSDNRWGQLDSLGKAEQRGIASRMYHNFPKLFNGSRILASSSYTPRCVMSMDEFTHQLDILNNNIEITATSGRQNSPLLRPFDINKDYLAWRKKDAWKPVYDNYIRRVIPDSPLKRALGDDFPFGADWRETALNEYYVVAGMNAMGCEVDVEEFFTPEEYRALWSCFNLRQYLQRTASELSTIPAEIAIPLISDIITTTDAAVAKDYDGPSAILRFGHAETLMPLLSQIQLRGCNYITDDYASVSEHWKDYDVVPMAANFQLILMEGASGRHYLLTMLNESPVPLIPGDRRTIIPWPEARRYLASRC